MSENLNLVEILKDCPKGTKLYSTAFGDVYFYGISDNKEYPICIAVAGNSDYRTLTYDGKLWRDYGGECILFPSREQRDWSKFNPKKDWFVPPCEFKDGDILSYQCKGFNNRSIYIYRYHKRFNTSYYVALSGDDNEFRIDNTGKWALNGYNDTVRFATEEEKQRLFNAIKEQGYKWNAEKRTLEKLVESKFKVGDWIISSELGTAHIIGVNDSNEYQLEYIDGKQIFSSIDYVNYAYDKWTIQDAKIGDVLEFGDHGRLVIGILSFVNETTGKIDVNCLLEDNEFKLGVFYNLDTVKPHPATKEQRDALMKAMNDAGYEWNAETKTLEKLVKPKFDPKTLKPFDKVLARDLDTNFGWYCLLFSHYKNEDKYPCVCVGEAFNVCIPYNEDTKHLVGTTDEAPEYYRYWEG